MIRYYGVVLHSPRIPRGPMAKIPKETLRSFLHDTLPESESAEIEKRLRADSKLREEFEEIRREEDRGEHSIGAIWRRNHLSCPSRDQLGGYLLEALDPELIDYIQFHLNTVGCSFCSANLEDLQKKQAEAAETTRGRRRRIVDSGAGLLREITRPN